MNTEEDYQKDLFDALTKMQRVLLGLICVAELVVLVIVMMIIGSYC